MQYKYVIICSCILFLLIWVYVTNSESFTVTKTSVIGLGGNLKLTKTPNLIDQNKLFMANNTTAQGFFNTADLTQKVDSSIKATYNDAYTAYVNAYNSLPDNASTSNTPTYDIENASLKCPPEAPVASKNADGTITCSVNDIVTKYNCIGDYQTTCPNLTTGTDVAGKQKFIKTYDPLNGGDACPGPKSCVPVCPAGTYWDGTACTKCTADKYSDAGALKCLDCPAGYYSVEGGATISACKTCQAGQYWDGSKCSTCSADTYSKAGSKKCTTCDSGSYSVSGSDKCTTCPGGQYWNGMVCVTCDTNTYSKAGSKTCTVCDNGSYSAAGSDKCTRCSAGTYWDSFTSSCVRCGINTYSGDGSRTCTSCPAGTHSNEGSSSSSQCQPCGPGTYLAGSACVSCSAGTYSNGSANTTCLPCTGNTYSTGGASSCTAIPANSTISSSNTAFRCNDGYYNYNGRCSLSANGHFDNSGNFICNRPETGFDFNDKYDQQYTKNNNGECDKCNWGDWYVTSGACPGEGSDSTNYRHFKRDSSNGCGTECRRHSCPGGYHYRNESTDICDQDYVAPPPKKCFSLSSMITMADGSKKKLSDIVAGDIVLSGKTMEPVQVLFTDTNRKAENVKLFGFNGTKPFVTKEHTFISTSNSRISLDPAASIELKHWDNVGLLKEGSIIYSLDTNNQKQEVKVKDVMMIENDDRIGNIVTSDHSYIVNDYCVNDDFPEIEKYPLLSLRIFEIVKMMVNDNFSENIEIKDIQSYIDDVLKKEIDVSSFENQLPIFLQICSENEKMMILADTLWAILFNFLN